MNIITLTWRTKALFSLALFSLVVGNTGTGQAAPATRKPANILWSKTKPGDRDEYVRTLQYLLKARSFKVNTDGVFGKQTKTAVMSLQRTHGLAPDGVVGGKTWKALVMPVKRGSRGYVVRAVQNQLLTIGYGDKVPVDGVFGQKTEAGVKQLQRAYVQKPDGVVGLVTWGLLLDGLEEGD